MHLLLVPIIGKGKVWPLAMASNLDKTPKPLTEAYSLSGKLPNLTFSVYLGLSLRQNCSSKIMMGQSSWLTESAQILILHNYQNKIRQSPSFHILLTTWYWFLLNPFKEEASTLKFYHSSALTWFPSLSQHLPQDTVLLPVDYVWVIYHLKYVHK